MAVIESREYVLKQVREAGVKLIRLWFTDICGHLKEVAVTAQQLEAVLEDGLNIDTRAVFGAQTHLVKRKGAGRDLVAAPDPSTYAVLPWVTADQPVARMFCDLLHPDGTPCDSDPRGVLKRALGRTSDAGYRVYVGGDISHFYLSEEGTVREPSETGSHYDASEDEPLLAARLETLVALEDLGIAVDSTLHESAAGQYAVNLQYSDALFMADALMTYRFAVKHIAREHGMRASFMPRPFGDKPGCGLHLTLSLDEAGKNAFFDPEDAAGLSATARSFVAGLITHCNEIALATNPWVNSYKRLGVATDAPSAATWAWGVEDSGERLDLVRIPILQTGHGASTRIEYRAADAACNPYLAIVAIIEAGLSGVNTQSPPPPRRERGDVAAECGNALPHTLWDAAEYAAQSELLNATLGPELTAVLVTRARDEWREHHAHISDWELKRYLLTL